MITAWRAFRGEAPVRADLAREGKPRGGCRPRAVADAPGPWRRGWPRRRPDHRPLAARRARHRLGSGRVSLDRIAAQPRHNDIGVLVNRYILPVQALENTSSKNLGL